MGTLNLSLQLQDQSNDQETLNISVSGVTFPTTVPPYSNSGTANGTFAALDYGGRSSPKFVVFRNTDSANDLILSFDGTNSHIAIPAGKWAAFPDVTNDIQVKSSSTSTTYTYSIHE